MNLNKLYIIKTDKTYPYHNIALEKILLEDMPKGSMTLYLWQNEHTVVIGRNQCAWRECNVSALQNDGGYLARRLSGGGAVYHDLGNLNFTFLYDKSVEDISKQTSVIAKAVATFGLHAEQSGRNDITIDGKKFSGNAYYTQGDRAYHHGTLLVNVDPVPLGKYLTTDAAKYRSKGVSSVRSRVVNLQTLCEDITIDSLADRLSKTFCEVYGMDAEVITEDFLSQAKILTAQKELEDWNWVYGRPMEFTWANEKRFPFGLIRIELNVKSGIISDCAFYSDAMSIDIFSNIKQAVINKEANLDSFKKALSESNTEESIKSAILELLEDAF